MYTSSAALTVHSTAVCPGQPGIILGFSLKLTPKGVVFSFVSVCQPHHAALRARDPLVISRQPVLGGRKRVASA